MSMHASVHMRDGAKTSIEQNRDGAGPYYIISMKDGDGGSVTAYMTPEQLTELLDAAERELRRGRVA